MSCDLSLQDIFLFRFLDRSFLQKIFKMPRSHCMTMFAFPTCTSDKFCCLHCMTMLEVIWHFGFKLYDNFQPSFLHFGLLILWCVLTRYNFFLCKKTLLKFCWLFTLENKKSQHFLLLELYIFFRFLLRLYSVQEIQSRFQLPEIPCRFLFCTLCAFSVSLDWCIPQFCLAFLLC